MLIIMDIFRHAMSIKKLRTVCLLYKYLLSFNMNEPFLLLEQKYHEEDILRRHKISTSEEFLEDMFEENSSNFI